jgi:hypothetical protein
MKVILKGRRFQTADDIITKLTDELKAIQLTSLEQCFQKWKRRWERLKEMILKRTRVTELQVL